MSFVVFLYRHVNTQYGLASAHSSDSCLMLDYVHVINFLLLLIIINFVVHF